MLAASTVVTTGNKFLALLHDEVESVWRDLEFEVRRDVNNQLPSPCGKPSLRYY
jgi:hypothetical protein